jgi:hypothetical protein
LAGTSRALRWSWCITAARKSGREYGNPMMYLPHDTEPDIIYVTFRDRTLYPRARWALFRGTKRSSHARRSTSHVFAGGAPGARTLNPRIKRGLPGRAGRSTCADATRQCPESTHRAGIRSALVPRVVPRYPGRVPGGSVTVSDGDCPGRARAEPPFFALLPAVRRPVRGMQNWTFGSPSWRRLALSGWRPVRGIGLMARPGG